MSDEIKTEMHIEPEDYERARLDATRALVIQNARFSRRYDFAKKWRSPRFQKILADIGGIVSGLGALLAASSVILEWTNTEDIPWLRVGMFVLLTALFVLFQNLDRALSASYERINETLRKRAGEMLEATGERLPATVSYEVADGEIRGLWRGDEEELASWSHELSDTTYLLVGDACLAGFDEPDKLSPAFFCFFDDEHGDQLREALEEQGASAEFIDEDLLESADNQRPWPS